MPDTTTPTAATDADIDDLRNRITNVRAWLSTNHALTYVPEEYSDGIHALLVHGGDTDGVHPVVEGCRFEDDAVGAAGGPDTADADELRARIAKVSAWLRTADAEEHVPDRVPRRHPGVPRARSRPATRAPRSPSLPPRADR